MPSRSRLAKPASRPSIQPDRVRVAASILVFLLLIVLVAAAYANANHEKFFFDSTGIMSETRRLADLPGAIRRLWQHPFAGDEQIAHVTFSLNYVTNRLMGFDPLKIAPFLIFNVFVHGLNAFLVYRLIGGMLRRFEAPKGTKRDWIPLACAAWFALNPIQASSVVYIIQRRGSLAALFSLAAVLAYHRGRWPIAFVKPSPRRRAANLLLCLICLYLAFRCKTVALTVPLALVALEFCVRLAKQGALRRSWPLLVGAALLVIALPIAFLAATGQLDIAHLRVRAYSFREIWSPWTHLLTEIRVFAHYLKLLLLPLPIWSCIDHEMALSDSLADGRVLFAIMLHSILLIASIWAAKRGKMLLGWGVFWFYLTLLPYALLPQDDLMVEYKTYLPSVGIALVLASLGESARLRFPVGSRVVAVATAVTLLGITISRNAIYQNEIALWSDATAKSPTHPRPRASLAAALAQAGRTDEAVALYEQVLVMDPSFAGAHVNLGLLLGAERKDEAFKHLQQAVELAPASFDANYNLANALVERRQLERAADHYRAAIAASPTLETAHYGLARIHAMQGRFDEAAKEYGEAIRLNESYSDARLGLGNVLAQQRRLKEALAEFQRAIDLNPGLALAQNNLGRVLQDLDRLPESIPYHREALRLDPTLAEAHLYLGIALERTGSTREALVEYEAAIHYKPGLTAAQKQHDALAARLGMTSSQPGR